MSWDAWGERVRSNWLEILEHADKKCKMERNTILHRKYGNQN